MNIFQKTQDSVRDATPAQIHALFDLMAAAEASATEEDTPLCALRRLAFFALQQAIRTKCAPSPDAAKALETWASEVSNG